MNDVPHIGHAYTTVAADVLARWRRLWGDDVFFLTGTDEHGLKVQRAAEAQGVTPAGAGRPHERARSARRGTLLDIANDDFIRTTEPRHHAAVQEFLQRVYDNGDIELGTYEGLYCVVVRGVLHRGRARRRQLPDPRPAGRARHRGELLLQAVALRGPPARRTTPRIPRPCSPTTRAQRGARLHQAGPARLLDEPHVDHVGRPAAVGPRSTSPTCGSTRCSTTAPRSGTATTASGSTRYWPADYHLIGKDILRFHAVYWPAMLMAAGLAPPKCVFAHGWLLVGGEKMARRALNQIAPADLVADFGVDGFRYHFLADQRFGPDGDFTYEAMVARYNADLANNFGNLANRVLNMAVNYCGGVVPDDARRTVRSSTRPRPRSTGSPTAMERARLRERLRRGVGPHPRRPTRTSRSGSRGRSTRPATPPRSPRVLGDCLEALRIVALLASPVIPRAAAELWRRLGLPGTPRGRSGCPTRPRWGQPARGRAAGEGRAALPADRDVT